MRPKNTNMWQKLTLASIATGAIVYARDISFPSLSGFSSDQAVMGIISPDITQAKFGGLTTYANLPYVHCLAQEGEEIEKFDIAILGAPFDTVCCPSLQRLTYSKLALDQCRNSDCL